MAAETGFGAFHKARLRMIPAAAKAQTAIRTTWARSPWSTSSANGV